MSEPDLTLTSLQELQADAIAGRVLDRIGPGHGPMIVPGWAADLFGRWGEMGGGRWQQYSPIYGPRGADVLGIEITATIGKTLSVQMNLNGENRVWAGVLRGPGFGS